MTCWRRAVALAMCVGVVSVPTFAQKPGAAPAQKPGAPRTRLVEVTGGFGLAGGASLGSQDANLRANASPAQPSRLFSTDSRLSRAWVVEARLGTRLTRRYGIEGRFGFSRPELRTVISADVEGAPGLTVVERVDQYVIDGSILVFFDGARIGGAVPYGSGGAGYVRQLHEGLTVIESGGIFHVGGGLTHRFFTRNRGFTRTAGVRADARFNLMSGGISVGEGPRPHVAISGSLFLGF